MTAWTTLLEWVGRQVQRSVAGPPPSVAIGTSELRTPRVALEYGALHTYLERRYASMVVLTFEQIESLLGCPLPAPAKIESEWWTDSVDVRRHSAAWTSAGRTAAPNLAAGSVAFERPA
jgi:hypothetical protein